MPAATPDFESLSREELVTVCKALYQAVQDLTARCEHLERRVQELEAGKPPKKTSQNSSVPPSNDQKPNSTNETRLAHKTAPDGPFARVETRQKSIGRTGGGRTLDPNPDAQIILRPDTCQSCGSFLLDALERTHAVYEKIELPKIKPIITRITQLECQCKHCGTRTLASPPANLEPGSPYGSSIQSLLTTLRFQHAIGYQRLCAVMNDVFDVSISEGAISNSFENLLEKLEPRVQEITDAIRDGSGVMSDETSANGPSGAVL